MLRSMTAFGRSSLEGASGGLVVEITSLNKKTLEVQFTSSPKELLRFEVDVRRWIAEMVSRGQLFVRVKADFTDVSPVKVRANLPLVRQLKAAWEAIGREWGSKEPVDIVVLSQQEGVLCYADALQDEEAFLELLRRGVEEALEALGAMKAQEGATLQKEVITQVCRVKEYVEAIRARSQGAPQRYRERLVQTLRESGVAADATEQERLLREVCLFADKVDVSEEVTRLFSHLDHLSKVLEDAEWRVGKKIEFLLQELGREINTVGSKSADYEVSRLVVEVKGALERIREQIQNVE